MRVAAVQLSSGPDRDVNLTAASHLVARAADDGARLVVLPELVNVLGSPEVLRAAAEPLDGPTGQWASELASTHQIWLVAGSMVELDGDRRFNTSVLIAPTGEQVASYRKIHLFDCDVPGAEVHESEVTDPGHEVVVADADEVRLGWNICFDLRFGDIGREAVRLGAQLLVVPAAFTAVTGEAHWDLLVRARAVEHQLFVIAAGQTGSAPGTPRWYGHSMIVDPWGRVLAQAGTEPEVVLADIDLDVLDQVRSQLPCVRRAGELPGAV